MINDKKKKKKIIDCPFCGRAIYQAVIDFKRDYEKLSPRNQEIIRSLIFAFADKYRRKEK